MKDLCRSLAGSRNEIQNRLNRSSGTALTSMLYNKVGSFFKSLQMTVIISSTMSVMTHSQEHDTQLVAARGERERERERRFIRFPCKCGSSAFVLNCITLDKC